MERRLVKRQRDLIQNMSQNCREISADVGAVNEVPRMTVYQTSWPSSPLPTLVQARTSRVTQC